MVKHIQTNCLNLFDHFVGLALRVKKNYSIMQLEIYETINKLNPKFMKNLFKVRKIKKAQRL